MAWTKEEKYMWYVCLTVAMTMILYGYDSSTFNAVQGSENWNEYFGNPDPNVIGSVNTAYTVGGIVAGMAPSQTQSCAAKTNIYLRFLLLCSISDRFGRKWAIIVGCVFVIISTFVSAFSPRTMGGFIDGRTIVGIGQGIALPAGPTYITELARTESRGKIMSFWQMNFGVGSFLAYWIGFAASKNSEKLGDWDWRIVIIFQLVAPILIIGLLFTCPETPRWYVKKDRIEEGMKVLRSVRNNEELVREELREITTAIAFENGSISPGYSALWKDRSIRRRLCKSY
jgi:MFS family permease